MLLSLVLLGFTKNLAVKAKLETAYMKEVKEGYDLRGACFFALGMLPPVKESAEEEGPEQVKEQEGDASSQQEETEETEETASLSEEQSSSTASAETEEKGEESSETGEIAEEEEPRKDYWVPRHEPYSLEFDNKEYLVFIKDEGAKLNVNALEEENKETFERLLAVNGVSQREVVSITNSLLDWLDDDNSVRPAGGESGYYESLPEPYPCKNGPLDSLEELTLVKGMNPEIYGNIEDDLTIYSTGMKININTASREVIHAVLGIDLKEADEVIGFIEEEGEVKNVGELKDLFFRLGVAGKNFEDAKKLMTTADTPFTTILSRGSTSRQYRLVVDRVNGDIVAVYPE